MTPEDTAAAVGAIITPTPVCIDPRAIKPFCGECGTPIDPGRITDAIGVRLPDGSSRLIGLCGGCLNSLDKASHQETIRRLNDIRARCFS